MNMIDVILKKRNGEELTKEEIEFFVYGYTDGSIPDYQVSALLMAIYFQKMTRDEIFLLTNAMKSSGDSMNLDMIKGIKVDKHSTGGVGDKITLIAAPVAAACGVPVAKLSGRGLGFTGGTIDKLEAIPGFRTSVEPEDFFSQVNRIGLAVAGQTAKVAPADKKIYGLRDVTGTVDILSLIASSIMSKKLSSGSDAIVLDVKSGEGAFMKTAEDAERLASIMCDIGRDAGKKTVAAVTDMTEPLGYAVGNAIEVIEAIETLKGKGPRDIYEIAITLSGLMIFVGEKADSFEEGEKMAEEAIQSGRALEKFRQFIAAQGGNPQVVDEYNLLPQAEKQIEIKSKESGYVKGIHAETIGYASERTGAGRASKEDSIDPSAGILLKKKIGDRVEKGETLAILYSSSEKKISEAIDLVEKAFSISQNRVETKSKVIELIGV